MKLLLRLLSLAALVAVTGTFSAAQEEAAKKDSPPADEGFALASHFEVKPLAVKFKRLSALSCCPDGTLLACDLEAGEIKVLDLFGNQLGTIDPGLAPQALAVASDGTILVGGSGKLAKLDRKGKVLATVPVPDNISTPITERRRSKSREPRVSGVAVSERDVFVAFGSGWSLGSKSKLFRLDRNLENPKVLAEGLRACCQRCDIVSLNGKVYVAENSAHRVVCYDRDGNVLGKWGARSRTGIEGFGACCNPMNLCFDAGGTLYTSESGLGRVKRYSLEGKFLGIVGHTGVQRFQKAGRTASSCSNIAIAVTPAGGRIFVMDYTNNVIRILDRHD